MFVLLCYDMHSQWQRIQHIIVEGPNEGHTRESTSWSEQGVKELLAGGAWGLWFLRLLRLDAFLFYWDIIREIPDREFHSTHGALACEWFWRRD